MKAILHGGGGIIHLTDADVFPHRLTVPKRIWSSKGKWDQPVAVDHELIYKYVYQLGNYYHYELEKSVRAI